MSTLSASDKNTLPGREKDRAARRTAMEGHRPGPGLFGVGADAQILCGAFPVDRPTVTPALFRRPAGMTLPNMAGIDVECANGYRRHIREDGINTHAFIEPCHFTRECGA